MKGIYLLENALNMHEDAAEVESHRGFQAAQVHDLVHHAGQLLLGHAAHVLDHRARVRAVVHRAVHVRRQQLGARAGHVVGLAAPGLAALVVGRLQVPSATEP